ncbi:ABC transporter ATP-binding protein [Gordonia soli]|uniref:Putative ABC transporter ATP-binding protein n=1 Tax=Gordonia soli NBRC 108243 TaxID=1223545 RepID=M0QLI0_9ACTN|nr:ATP-binding cassette domain-containing protein [Gordonia soli]GAC69166.1 putative ABC transporter ATP-binding protein [Gordonia soli NBRC 108243]
MIEERKPGRGCVRVRGLSVSAGDETIVAGIDLDVMAGRVLTLVGPSGAGKSTIAAAVAGVLPQHLRPGGSIAVDPGIRVAHLPQDAALTLNPARRIGASLGELVTIHGAPPRRWRRRRQWRSDNVDALLTRVGLPAETQNRRLWTRRFPSQFSGGQRTRLALAHVLATRPDVLVLDEPSNGLDAISRQRLIEALADLRDHGTALLLVTHDERIAAELGDDVISISDGRIRPHFAPGTGVRMPAPNRVCNGNTEPENRAPTLAVDHLRVRIAGDDVLAGPSFSAASGELIGLVGASGSGKTTILRSIAGLVPIAGGTVEFDGVPLRRLARRSSSTMGDIQYVCQEVRASFEPDRPILHQVARTAIRLRGTAPQIAHAEAADILHDLGLSPDEIRRPPDGLSGGQLRRAALARALVARPRLLLCDEVTTGVEAGLADSLLRLLADRCRDAGMTLLVAGHDLRSLLARVDRLIVVDGGRVTDDLPAGEWSHASPTLRRLLAADGVPPVGTVADSD